MHRAPSRTSSYWKLFNMRNLPTKAIVCALVLNLLVTGSAFAYLDAGTGSMILQAVLGGIAGLVVLIKMYWKEFTAMFRGKVEKKD